MRFTRMVLIMALVAGTGAALAQDRRPDARLTFSSTSFGLLFGFSQGQGALEFQGRKYPFTVSGIKVATLGISKVDALGQVYRLRELADFPGRYIAVEGGLTVVQGGGNAVLRNERGVMLYLQNVQYGLDLTLGGGGVDIALTGSADPSAPAVIPDAPAR
ncbi:MAG: hypothetical protein F9K25_16005 [Candidatus Contendobacter sp.]|nr:MAG: hypothetical protein F9K25_16005 [Candidatus Contendobacter sp.]